MTDQPDEAAAPVLLTERHGSVLVVTMNRPRQRNALNKELRDSLRAAFDAFDADPGLTVAILTGNGPSFSAGGDLKEMSELQLQVPPVEDFELMLGSRGKLTKPVIAAVNGHALAGGFLLAQDCDLCVASDTAVFGVSEVKRGRGSPWAAPLSALIPKRIMMQLLLTGEPLTAQRAYEVGLVNEVVPGEELLPAALALATLISENAPLSVAAAKQMVEFGTEVGQTSALQAAHWLYNSVYTSEDAQEGPRAFAEKRKPRWTGR